MTRKMTGVFASLILLREDELLRKERKSIEKAKTLLNKREKLLKERNRLFRWLDGSEGAWLGAADKNYIKQWVLGKKQGCRRCRQLAADLSQLSQVSSLPSIVNILIALASGIIAGIAGRALDLGKASAYYSSVAALVVAIFVFVSIISYDSNQRKRLTLELVKFSNSRDVECDVPCGMHRVPCRGNRDVSKSLDESQNIQEVQE